ncbi:exonuclease V-like [Anneissia japonica]|uniref:exonuclease V-like n=1 Tax=Anneissia japonica TaxID=1529436 RepID=UPI0014258AAA|nr:exonuclease V-like [Anneissia japonica]XP_033123499.1 exonuclease V-like [Anneissia japonica]
MIMSRHAQEPESPTQEYPLSGTSSTDELWDSISDMDLLEMVQQYEGVEERETSCHKESENKKWQSLPKEETHDFRKRLKLEIDETPETEETVLNYIDEKVQKATQHRNLSKDQFIPSTSEQYLSLENHPKDQLSDNNLTPNQIAISKFQTQTKQSQHEKKEIKDSGVNGDHKDISTCEDKPEALSSGDDVVAGQSGTRQRKVFTPFDKFRGRYLNVTDLTSQAWCEQALVYSFTRIRPTVEVDSSPRKTGASIHLARELEVHDIATIPVTSREDMFAIKLLNMLTSIIALTTWTSTIRELPVFGELPNSNMFVSGIIDEIKYNAKGELELIELKTRTSQREPSKAQFKTHSLQVMLYKHLFDGLVKGSLSRDIVLSKLSLDATKTLGENVIEQGHNLGLECTIFGDLLDVVLLRFQFTDLPLVDALKIEYFHQKSGLTFANRSVEMDADWLNETMKHYLKFWNGNRDAEGVDIEEAWKCKSCAYYDDCEWIEKRTQELSIENRLNNGM